MLRLQRVLLLASLLTACANKGDGASGGPDSKPKPHAPVNGPALWTIRIVDISVQPLDERDAPKGDPRRVEARPSGTSACRLEKDPGNEVVTAWFNGFFDEQGKSRMTHDRSDPEDIANCLVQPAINTNLGITAAGEYKITVKAWFDEPKPQPR